MVGATQGASEADERGFRANLGTETPALRDQKWVLALLDKSLGQEHWQTKRAEFSCCLISSSVDLSTTGGWDK